MEVYINGVLAARRSGYTTGYVPAKISDEAKAAIKPGDWNLVAVKVHQGYGGQMMDFGISAFTDSDFDYTEDFSDKE